MHFSYFEDLFKTQFETYAWSIELHRFWTPDDDLNNSTTDISDHGQIRIIMKI